MNVQLSFAQSSPAHAHNDFIFCTRDVRIAQGADANNASSASGAEVTSPARKRGERRRDRQSASGDTLYRSFPIRVAQASAVQSIFIHAVIQSAFLLARRILRLALCNLFVPTLPRRATRRLPK
jgi:hypothetical protein